jgi:Tfp pilus assembly protein PilF
MAAATVALALALGALTVRRNRVWRSDDALFRDATAVAPRLALAQIGLAEIDMRLGAAHAAHARCAIAAEVTPWSADAWGCLAGAAERMGRHDEVPAHYARMFAAGTVSFDRRTQHVRWLARHDPDAARRALDALARERSWSPRAQQVLAALARQLGPAAPPATAAPARSPSR